LYCLFCGGDNPAFGKYCHECGKPLVRTNSDKAKNLTQRTPTEQELVALILRTDSKPNECHQCGAESGLTRHEFAIAKVASVNRAWGETAAHVGLSTLSIVAAPVTGFGVFSWKRPNKTTSFRLFPAELVLCRSCLSLASTGSGPSDDAYRFHPWAKKARHIGYDKYLSPEELAKLTPKKG